MACSVAVAGSPVFSPSRVTLSCKSSQETLNLALGHLKGSDGSPLSTSSPSSSSSSSPFRVRFQKGVSNFRSFKKEVCDLAVDPCSTSGSVEASSSMPTGALLKRKRPARIDIPQMPSMGFAAEEGKGEVGGMDVVEVDATRFSVFCKRGRVRESMEDRYSAAVNVNGDPQLAFFGVFDGHGGTKAAEFVSKNIETHVISEVAKVGGADGNGIEKAIKAGYLSTDSQLLKEEVTGGACCVTALIMNDELIVSNAGDCRAVMSRGGTAEALTSDHRPSREDERDRLERLGGYVDCYRGVWRLQGSLAVSRGMGDAHLKQWVIAEPETKIIRIKTECEFLILASDGLWDKVSNQEAVNMARPMCMDSNNTSLMSACKKLAELSVSRGSIDDVSVMIVRLKHFS